MPIEIEIDYPVFTIVINNPEVRNAIDKKSAEQLADAFREFESDDKAKVAVLWGAEGNFCAGANLKALATNKLNRLRIRGDGPMGPSRMLLNKPVIAAVSGYAVAGGLELAIWCDLRVVEKSTIFGVFCRRYGVPLIDGGTVRLPRLIGLSRALDMILTGRPVSADEALQWGLANRVVKDGTSRKVAESLANEISHFPQICMKNDRISAYTQFGLSIHEAMKQEFKYGIDTLIAGEFMEGSKRFSSGEGKHGKF